MKNAVSDVAQALFPRDKAWRILMGLALLSHIGIWALLAWEWTIVYQPGKDFIPLHYKVIFGIDYYANWYYIFGYPAIALIMLLVDYALSRWVTVHDATMQRLLATTALINQIIIGAALYFAILVNIF